MPKAKTKRVSQRKSNTGKRNDKESPKTGEELLTEALAAVAPKQAGGAPGNETVGTTIPPVSSSTSITTISTSTPSYSLLSQCPLLGNNISAAIKGKIVASSFIDLAQLLPSSRSETNQTQRFQLAFNPDAPTQLLLQQQPVSKVITNIFDWTTAFHTFSAIYLERHPDRTQELLRYSEIIRFACRKFGGFGWRTYDVEFRTQQALNPTRSWATIDGVLWLEIFTPSASGSSPFRVSAFNRQPPLNSPRTATNQQQRVCFPFNSRAGCFRENCMYQHICSLCRAKGHNRFSCAKGKKGASRNAVNNN